MKTIHQSISILNHIMNKILGGISRPPNMASLWHYSLIIDLFCRRSFSLSRDLHFEEIRLVEALVDVSEFSEELNRLVPNVLVLLVHEKQLGLKSGTFPYWQDNEFYKWVFFSPTWWLTLHGLDDDGGRSTKPFRRRPAWPRGTARCTGRGKESSKEDASGCTLMSFRHVMRTRMRPAVMRTRKNVPTIFRQLSW